MLVPEIAARESADVTQLRTASLSAIDAVRAASPEIVYLVGTGPVTGSVVHDAVGDFSPWGADVQVYLSGSRGDDDRDPDSDGHRDADSGVDVLPLSVAVGAWLAGQRGWASPLSAVSVAADGDQRTCRLLGADLANNADRVGLLVMSDGSARRSDDGPRPYDPRAGAYDASVVAGLRSGEPAGLLAIDPDLALAVSAEGLNPLWVLAGAAGDVVFDTDVLYEAAPYGVGYYVVVWERHG